MVSMNRMRESEEEKAREDREVGSRTRCNMGLVKEIWHAIGDGVSFTSKE